jgi:hypothetical protein
MHLEEMKKEIEMLVLEKGFYNKPENTQKKLLFAFIARARTHKRETALLRQTAQAKKTCQSQRKGSLYGCL